MSYRPPRNVKRGQPTKVRGASRPIDPRYAPGGPPRRGMDSFAIGLVVVSVIAIFVVVLIIAMQPKSGTTSTAVNFDPSATDVPSDPAALVTATAIAFATLTSPDVLPRISVQETKALQDANNVMIIDVREAQFYNQSHIKGAISIPQADVHDRLAEIPKTGNVVVYCDCPHDEESAGVAYSLRTVNYTNVKVLAGPHALALWSGAGFPVEP